MGNVFNRYGAGGGKSEGIYIWKKYEYKPSVTITNPTFTLDYLDGYTFPIVSANFDWSQLPSVYNSSGIRPSESTEASTVISFLDGFTNASSGKFYSNTGSYSGQIMVYKDSSTWQFLNGVNYTNVPSFRISVSMAGWSTSQKTYSYSGTKTIPASIGSLIGYVVSDDSSAYPDKAEQGGYWYEKMSLSPSAWGCTKFKKGSFTLASSVYYTNVSNTLGVVPKFAFLWSNNTDGTKWQAITYTENGNGTFGALWGSSNDGIYYYGGSATTTTVCFETRSNSTAYYYKAGTFNYILLG